MADLRYNTQLLTDIATAIEKLPAAGLNLPTLINPGEAGDLAIGKQLIDGDGNLIIGTADAPPRAEENYF